MCPRDLDGAGGQLLGERYQAVLEPRPLGAAHAALLVL